jgi:hypothetical protein
MKYRINNTNDNFEFEGIYFNGWNYYNMNKYINLILGGRRKYILIDGFPLRHYYQLIDDMNGIGYHLITVINKIRAITLSNIRCKLKEKVK